MGVDIPDDFDIDLNLSGGSTIDGDFTVNNTTRIRELPTIELRVRELPEIKIGVTELPKVQLGVDPIDFSLRIKEIPAIRAHLPANFKVGLSLLGNELLSINLCGEAQVITEDYVPNPCEICGPPGNAREISADVSRIELIEDDG
ncbi:MULTISPECIES: hypothetical protein [unclassified Ruegeria]|uniref:hypothetical protein n=1 Tax=unclassified Ruegeria TaxID=2625375 RepID=UPI00149281DE|nr:MULTISPECIES: hypothetical protein [unclassified Ruegeria]NOD88210.1 hypothetical protein [Ruegeria sp. HKCCD4318]NOE13119.1 hypothetical protein [Ruegeria sp. HKCCD4318-2]NOG11339.1 hypothetical protein [Ruegeria sp. HKCCD4315]